ncbi:cell division protein SepF [Candidatus Pacearchaeota archaeon]|nr:cell division protein SepF [Candidatus Pacearchaeota archaeon]
MGIKESLASIFGKQPSKDEDYLEIDLGSMEKKAKVQVRPFTLRKYDDVNVILNAMREGYTISVIDIKPLKNKDVIELRRAISKIKKTADALEGSVAGFGENIIIATPSFAEIYKTPEFKPAQQQNPLAKEEMQYLEG